MLLDFRGPPRLLALLLRTASAWQRRHQLETPSRVLRLVGNSVNGRIAWQCRHLFTSESLGDSFPIQTMTARLSKNTAMECPTTSTIGADTF